MKMTPKSCSCGHCKSIKHSRGGRLDRKADEKTLRQSARQALHHGRDDQILPAPVTPRFS